MVFAFVISAVDTAGTLHALPEENYNLAVYLFDHFNNVLCFSGTNKMTSPSLATCLGPSLLTPAETDTRAMESYNVERQNAVAQYLLDNWREIRADLRPVKLSAEDAIQLLEPPPIDDVDVDDVDDDDDGGGGGGDDDAAKDAGSSKVGCGLGAGEHGAKHGAGHRKGVVRGARSMQVKGSSSSASTTDATVPSSKSSTCVVDGSQLEGPLRCPSDALSRRAEALQKHTGDAASVLGMIGLDSGSEKQDSLSSGNVSADSLSIQLRRTAARESMSTARYRSMARQRRSKKTTALSHVQMGNALFGTHSEQQPEHLTPKEFRELCYELGLYVAGDEVFLSISNAQRLMSRQQFVSWWRSEGAFLNVVYAHKSRRRLFTQAVAYFQFYDVQRQGVLDGPSFKLLHLDLVGHSYANVHPDPAVCYRQIKQLPPSRPCVVDPLLFGGCCIACVCVCVCVCVCMCLCLCLCVCCNWGGVDWTWYCDSERGEQKRARARMRCKQ